LKNRNDLVPEEGDEGSFEGTLKKSGFYWGFWVRAWFCWGGVAGRALQGEI